MTPRLPHIPPEPSKARHLMSTEVFACHVSSRYDSWNESLQEQDRDKERLEAKGKTTDVRALRVSTVRDTWPQLAQAFEAKRAADAAKKAGKAARKAAAVDKATAGMAARLQAFLQPRTASAPAKVTAGVRPVSRSASWDLEGAKPTIQSKLCLRYTWGREGLQSRGGVANCCRLTFAGLRPSGVHIVMVLFLISWMDWSLAWDSLKAINLQILGRLSWLSLCNAH